MKQKRKSRELHWIFTAGFAIAMAFISLANLAEVDPIFITLPLLTAWTLHIIADKRRDALDAARDAELENLRLKTAENNLTTTEPKQAAVMFASITSDEWRESAPEYYYED